MDEHGVPSFQLLQNAFDGSNTAAIQYFLFDLPFYNHYDLRNARLTIGVRSQTRDGSEQRKNRSSVRNLDSPNIS